MSDMIIIGDKCDAIRYYRDSKGCEFRASGVIISGNEDLAKLFDIINEKKPTDGLPEISKLSGLDSKQVIKILSSLFNDLYQSGLNVPYLYKDWNEYVKNEERGV
ncbi:MAG: hypothetical protein ACFWTY_03450 [Shouchella clausii]|jgi:hypothetical protein|uniref:hypothetical protein n=1 Tax=Shouchella tritolerans TaxID=2979466 RepID=UPI000788EA80|nr:hypothetical protein [Shouchella tritolerans]